MRSAGLRRFLQRRPDFVIGGLAEVLVPGADSSESIGHLGADDLVGNRCQLLASVTRANGHRDNHPRRPQPPDRRHCRPHRRAGREPVIDEDRHAACDCQCRTTVAVRALPALELLLFEACNVFDGVVRNAAQADNVVIEDANAAARDRAHCELRLQGDAELPHDEDIEGRAEGRGDFECDRHPAARQTEHEDVAAHGIRAESASEDSAGFAPIGKPDGGGNVMEHGHTGRVQAKCPGVQARKTSRTLPAWRPWWEQSPEPAENPASEPGPLTPTRDARRPGARHDRCLDDSAMQRIFADRHHAGAQLAEYLWQYESRLDVVVLGLAPGGVPVAWEVARTLGAPLDVIVVRAVRAPRDPDLVIGSVASGGISVLNHRVVTALAFPRATLDVAIHRALPELCRCEAAYRGHRVPLSLAGRIAIIVDDGTATRATMRAAVHAVRENKPARIVAAAPVAARATCDMLETLADEVVCAWTPESLSMIGLWYRYFSPTTDDEIRALLRHSDTQRLECGSRVLAQWDG